MSILIQNRFNQNMWGYSTAKNKTYNTSSLSFKETIGEKKNLEIAYELIDNLHKENETLRNSNKKKNTWQKIFSTSALLAFSLTLGHIFSEYNRINAEAEAKVMNNRKVANDKILWASNLLNQMMSDTLKFKGEKVSAEIQKLPSNGMMITFKPINTDYKGILLISNGEVYYNTTASNIPKELWPHYIDDLNNDILNLDPLIKNYKLEQKI